MFFSSKGYKESFFVRKINSCLTKHTITKINCWNTNLENGKFVSMWFCTWWRMRWSHEIDTYDTERKNCFTKVREKIKYTWRRELLLPLPFQLSTSAAWHCGKAGVGKVGWGEQGEGAGWQGRKKRPSLFSQQRLLVTRPQTWVMFMLTNCL